MVFPFRHDLNMVDVPQLCKRLHILKYVYIYIYLFNLFIYFFIYVFIYSFTHTHIIHFMMYPWINIRVYNYYSNYKVAPHS
jgi:hypothetical protein